MSEMQEDIGFKEFCNKLKRKTMSPQQKAWETRRARGTDTNKNNNFESHRKNYDTKRKNEFRDKVIESFKKINPKPYEDIYYKDIIPVVHGPGHLYCLTLESPQFLFVNALEGKHFIVVEHDKEQYQEMCSNLPKNVGMIYNADLSIIKQLNHNYSCAFLDFCGTLDKTTELLKFIMPKIRKCRKLALTFSLRGNKKEWEDYKFDIVRQMQLLFPAFKLEYANAYRDSSPMIGIILYNEYGYEYKEEELIAREVSEWSRMACMAQFHCGLYEIINPNASTNRITDKTKCHWLFNNMPKRLLKRLHEYVRYQNDDYLIFRSAYHAHEFIPNTTFAYFIDLISRG